jgi:YD repeat-containing protein
LRVTKESHYSASNVLQEEVTYSYDASEKRTAKRDRLTTETYNYTAGFQLDSITGTNGNEEYDYDDNGRLTLIQRDGVSLDLEHDGSDRSSFPLHLQPRL